MALGILREKGVLAPAKYNGMQAKIMSDDSFTQIMETYHTLLALKQRQDIDGIKNILRSIPQNHAVNNQSIELRRAEASKKFIIELKDLNEFFAQLERVYPTNPFESKQVCKKKLKELHAWISWLESTNKKAPSVPLTEIVLNETETNPHMLNLAATFNETVQVLHREVTEKLREFLTHKAREFVDMSHLLQVYRKTKTIEKPNGIYLALIRCEEKILILHNRIQERVDNGQAQDINDWVEIEKIRHHQLQPILDNDDCKALVTVYDRLTVEYGRTEDATKKLRAKNATIRELQKQLRISSQQFNAQLDDSRHENQLLTTRIEAQNNQIQILAEETQRLTTVNSDLNIQNGTIPALHDEIARQALEIERLTAENQALRQPTPVNTDDVHENPETNYAFLIRCLSSPTAFKVYGTIFGLAGLALLGAVSLGAIPTAFGLAAAASTLVVSVGFFYKAGVNDGAGAGAAANLGLQHV